MRGPIFSFVIQTWSNLLTPLHNLERGRHMHAGADPKGGLSGLQPPSDSDFFIRPRLLSLKSSLISSPSPKSLLFSPHLFPSCIRHCMHALLLRRSRTRRVKRETNVCFGYMNIPRTVPDPTPSI